MVKAVKKNKKTKITVHENSAWPLLELKKGGFFL